MTSILVTPVLLNILYDLLERFIKRNFDIEKIDFFAGLDARGFYLAPTMAKMLGKGFIPIRKVNKIPKSNSMKIATNNYKTEYSEDAFGLELRSQFDPIEGNKKCVLMFDDLLATGGSLVSAANVLRNVGLNVEGACTIYDVFTLRKEAKNKLDSNNIRYKVLINENNVPNDCFDL